MLAELAKLTTEGELAIWAKDGLSRKNQLVEADARTIEIDYQQRLEGTVPLPGANDTELSSSGQIPVTDASRLEPIPALAFPKEPTRKRSKAHLLFVGTQPCLVCQQKPVDAHHLKFAQQRALGRKVSDEFTVPLCRTHHQDLHRNGNEKAWWSNLQIEPLPIARGLWAASPVHERPEITTTPSTKTSADRNGATA